MTTTRQTFNDNHQPPPTQRITINDRTESNLIALGALLAQIKQDLDRIVDAWEGFRPIVVKPYLNE